MAEKSNPWLEVRQPLRDTSYPERDRDEWNEWFGCIAVSNDDDLNQFARTLRDFNYQPTLEDFTIEFGRQIQGSDGCLCKRHYLHTHFVLRVIGNIERNTAYQMACDAFQELELVPVDHYKGFSYLASVYQIELLADML